jgi:hypothetical protein
VEKLDGCIKQAAAPEQHSALRLALVALGVESTAWQQGTGDFRSSRLSLFCRCSPEDYNHWQQLETQH